MDEKFCRVVVVMWISLTRGPISLALQDGSFQVTGPKSFPRLLFPSGAEAPLRCWGFSRGLGWDCAPTPRLQLTRRQPSPGRVQPGPRAEEWATSSSGEAASCCPHRESVLASALEIAQGQRGVLPSPTYIVVWGESNPRFPSIPLLGFLTLVWNSLISSHLSTDPLFTTDLTEPLSS